MKCDEEEEYLSYTVRENGSWAGRPFQKVEREGSFGAVWLKNAASSMDSNIYECIE